MTGKDKIIYILLVIITLGIYLVVIRKKKNNSPNGELSLSSKITVNLDKLRDLLGGKNNIAGSEYTHTKVKIYVNDRNKTNIEAIKSLKGISGIFAGSKYITIIVGNQAKQLSETI